MWGVEGVTSASYKKTSQCQSMLITPIFTIVINLWVESNPSVRFSIMGNFHSSNNYFERLSLDNSSMVVLRKTKSPKGREVVDTWSADYYSFGRRIRELMNSNWLNPIATIKKKSYPSRSTTAHRAMQTTTLIFRWKWVSKKVFF